MSCTTCPETEPVPTHLYCASGSGVLDCSIDTDARQFCLCDGHSMSALRGDQYYYATLEDCGNIEHVKLYRQEMNCFYMLRGIDCTPSRCWPKGTRVHVGTNPSQIRDIAAAGAKLTAESPLDITNNHLQLCPVDKTVWGTHGGFVFDRYGRVVGLDSVSVDPLAAPSPATCTEFNTPALAAASARKFISPALMHECFLTFLSQYLGAGLAITNGKLVATQQLDMCVIEQTGKCSTLLINQVPVCGSTQTRSLSLTTTNNCPVTP